MIMLQKKGKSIFMHDRDFNVKIVFEKTKAFDTSSLVI